MVGEISGFGCWQNLNREFGLQEALDLAQEAAASHQQRGLIVQRALDLVAAGEESEFRQQPGLLVRADMAVPEAAASRQRRGLIVPEASAEKGAGDCRRPG